MWIAGGQTPSFMTLSEFRKSLGKDIKIIFKEVVKLAVTSGVIDGTEIYIDHTKVEADANRHRVTWRKNIERHLATVEADLDKLLELIDQLNDQEECEFPSQSERDSAVEAITPELLDALAARINQQLKTGHKERQQATQEKETLRKGKERLKQKARYQATLETMGDKNSMAKADPEAPAMMMKDKISIKPGYNVGIATQNGIVVGYDVSNNPNDGNSFKAMVTEAQTNLERKTERICADAGYGNTENYRYLESENIDSYVKYPGWDKDLKAKRSPFEAESFKLDPEHDCYACPNGNSLSFHRIEKRLNKRTGFIEESREYRALASDCAACPLKEKCTKAEARSIRINAELRRFRQQVVQNLASPMGQRMRSLRSVEVETVFGIQKRCLGFGRFNVRGSTGASIESGLFLTSLNLRRLHQAFVRFLKCGSRPVPQLARA